MSEPLSQPPAEPADDKTKLKTPVLPGRSSDGVAVPGYAVFERLGAGGMGAVYRARDEKLDRVVALKVMLGEGNPDEKGAIRFLAEAQAGAAVRHPNVVEVFDYGDHGGRPYMALEYCPGGSLADRLKAGGGSARAGEVAAREGEAPAEPATPSRSPARQEPRPPKERPTRLPPRGAAVLVGKIAAGVAAAHAAGIVHRDLKPANVLFDAAGEPKVTDFGIAKRAASDLTRTLSVMGTPHYMSPEQAGGGAKYVGPPADVWALGVVLYQAVAGGRPFDADTTEELLARVVAADFVSLRRAVPGIPRDLDLICRKCLEKAPADRYPTAGELADDLGRFARGEPISVRPMGTVERAYKWSRRNPAVAGSLVAVVLSLALGTVISTVNYRRAEEQRAAADEQRGKAEAEAMAKGQALADLEQTNRRLEAEKDATEVAYLRGLFRPFAGLSPDSEVYESPAALEALRSLNAVPDTRIRLRLFEVVLTADQDPAGLGVWRRPLVAATVGLDRRAGVDLKNRLGGILASGSSTPAARTASAWWATELPPDRVVDERAARALADRAAGETGPNAVWVTAGGSAKAAGRLPPAAAAGAVEPAARRLAARMAGEEDPAHLYGLAVGLADLTAPLAPAEAAALTGPAARRMAKKMAGGVGYTDLQLLTRGLEALAGRLAPDDAAAVASALAAQLAGEQDRSKRRSSAGLLKAVAGRLAPDAAADLGPALLARIKTETDSEMLDRLARGLAAVADRLTPSGAAALVGPAARHLAAVINAPEEPFDVYKLSRALEALAGWAGPDDAVAVARTLADRVSAEREAYLLAGLARAQAAAAGRVPANVAADVLGPTVQRLAAGMSAETNPVTLAELAHGLGALAERPNPAHTAAAASAARRLSAATTQETSPPKLSRLAEGLAAVAVRLAPAEADAEAVPVARRFAAAMVRETHTGVIVELFPGLKALARWLPPEEMAAAAGPAARRLAAAIDTERNPSYLNAAVRQLAEVCPTLSDADLLSLLKSHGFITSLREAAVAEFGRRSGRTDTPAKAAVLGWAATVAKHSPPFADVWEFVDWVEANRPDLVPLLTSRPAVK